jgi:hypothetical protein
MVFGACRAIGYICYKEELLQEWKECVIFPAYKNEVLRSITLINFTQNIM